MGFEALKERQAAAWGGAKYELVADNAADLHEDLVGRLGVNAGERWLDLATGTGPVAMLAARRGATVTGQDFAPELIDTARQLARQQGLEIAFDVGDCERLPYADASFGVVSSALGAVFAPDHGSVAHELSRVCRAGGRLGLAAWRPGGEIAKFYGVLAGFQPPPPEDAGKPLDWGRPEYANKLLGKSFELEFFEAESPLLGESPEAIWELFIAGFGPIKALVASLDDQRRDELRNAFVDYLSGYLGDNRNVSAPREYLLIIGRRKADRAVHG